MSRRLRVAVAGVVVALQGACGNGDSSSAPTDAAGAGSFARLQSEVSATSCAFSACHAPSNSSGSSLVLSGDGVYASLVNALPTQATARADGLRRVTPGKPDLSLLWHKVNGFTAGHHAHDYGAPMPAVGPSLPAGQIEFIRQWIAAGAPQSGEVADPKLLASTVSVVPYVPLAAPASGFQVRLTPYTIAKGSEREVFLYAPVGNAQEVWINRIQTHMRTGSHHFLLYSFSDNAPTFVLPTPAVLRDLKDSVGNYVPATLGSMLFHVFFAGTQNADGDYNFPAGVAIRLGANAHIDLNAHYVNGTSLPISGEGEANLYAVPQSQVQFEAQPLNLVNADLTIPQGRDTTIRKTFKFSTLTRVVMLNSHMHKHGLKFVVRVSGGPRDSEVVYTNEAWDHPAIVSLTTPLVLQAGEGLTSEVTYRGDPDKVIRFGLTAEDEMNIIFGYWY